jgi:membrane protein DedA with SNARE-associated domain
VLDVLTDVGDHVGALLHSPWLLPVLALMIAIDGPLPVLPSETVLMAAATLAFARHDTAAVLALFAVAVLGSLVGDVLVFWLARGSRRLIGLTGVENGIAGWVNRHLLARPGYALVGARLLPGGRLVSGAAAGRFGLGLRRFLPWVLISSAVWAGYILAFGLALGPVTGGSPTLCLLAGVAVAVLTGAAFALVQRLHGRRTAAA